MLHLHLHLHVHVPGTWQVVYPWTAAIRWPGWNHILCMESLKMTILAKTCVCPGFAGFIGNLVASSSAFSTANLDVSDRG
jgi:hypothetical protein